MAPPGDFERAFKPLHNRRFGMGCLSVLLAWAALAIGLWVTLPPHSPHDELAPFRAGLVVVSGALLAVAAASLWGLVFPYRPLNPGSGLPRVSRHGRVVADGEPLCAPLSGTPCVAYRCVLSRRHRRQNGRWSMQWVHVGAASMAWSLSRTDGPPLTVRTVTQIVDEAPQLDGAAVLARARHWVDTTAFEPRSGTLGGMALSMALLADMKDVDVPEGRPYRRDWRNTRDGEVDLQQMQWHEALLPVGADVTVAGHLRGSTFVVPPEAIEPIRAACSAEGRVALDIGPDQQMPAGDVPQRAPIGQVMGAVMMFGGLGAVLAALARLI